MILIVEVSMGLGGGWAAFRLSEVHSAVSLVSFQQCLVCFQMSKLCSVSVRVSSLGLRRSLFQSHSIKPTNDLGPVIFSA